METQFPNAAAKFTLQQLDLVSFRDEDNTSKTNGSSRPAAIFNDRVEPLEIEYVEKILNYKFKNKSLLLQAFTDPSFDENCVSYEVLEFLGDSVLNFVMTNELFDLYLEESPGSLTKLRAVNVDTEKLARVAVKHNLYRCLRHKRPLLDDQVKEFIEGIEEYPLHSRGLLKVPKSLADIVESTIGALYKDCNNDNNTVWKVIKPLLEPIITLDQMEKHPMSELVEKCQSKNLKYRFDESCWERNRHISLYIEGRLAGHGYHHVKKDTARYLAARNALDHFSNIFKIRLYIYTLHLWIRTFRLYIYIYIYHCFSFSL